jgi:hypothetical protein
MADALDALAPAAPVTPATPAPVAAPPVASPTSDAPAAPSAAPAAAPAQVAAAPAPTGPALVQQLAEQLGIPAAELRESLALTARMRGEYQRRQQLERDNDPGVQQSRARADALHRLMVETYGPEVADSMRELPSHTASLREQRAEAAQSELTTELRALGIEDPALVKDIEGNLTDRLNGNRRLNDLYHGSPEERRACIREMLGVHEKIADHALLRQSGQKLREHAARLASAPRAARHASVTPTVRQETPTSTDPVLRRREGNAIASRQLDDIWGYTN